MAEMFKAAKTSSRIDHAKYGDWKARFFAASGDIKLEVILNRLVMAIFPEQFCSVIKPERLLRICNALQEWTGIRLSEKPEDYGLHFWWGDTVGYRREGNAWVASDGSSRNFEFSGDNAPTWGKDIGTLQSEGWITSAGVLAPEHDAAHVHWGGNWRMPTKDELTALNSNCDWTWTSRNGVSGYVVRGRGDYSEASIFLPAAGYGYGTSLFDAGSSGYYWSSVPDSGSNGYSWNLEFDSGRHDADIYFRYNWLSVRPVKCGRSGFYRIKVGK